METTTSFDLNRAIQQWRENLAQSPAFRGENLNELESHLGDSIATWQTRGLSAEEAFLIATRRIGRGGSLESEFGKVNKSAIWLDRLFWMLIGYQLWSFISSTIGAITRNTLFLGLNGAGYDFKAHSNHILPVTLFTMVNLAGFVGSLALCWCLVHRAGPRFGHWFGRLSQRRTTWVLMFGALYLLSLSISNRLIGGMDFLLRDYVDHEKIIAFYTSVTYSYMIASLISVAIFTWLTLFLARKRLRLNQA